jgi:predicted small metal-binding protein
MRVIDCQCGQTLQAANDDELASAVRAHVDEAHPDMALDDDQVKGLVAEQAYTATDA